MRRVRYQVATSLDGFIADQADGYGWIKEEPEFDFAVLFADFDTLLMGRRTYEQVTDQLEQFSDKEIFVFSTKMRQDEHPDVTVVNGNVDVVISELRSRPGKDIWLYGGGQLFRRLLEGGHVSTVELAVMPVLLGSGLRFLPESKGTQELKLDSYRHYPASGMMLLNYSLENGERDFKEYLESIPWPDEPDLTRDIRQR